MSPAAATDRLKHEVERAAQHYYHTDLQQGIDNRTKRILIERILPFVKGPQVLDLGYVDGLWTDALLAQGFAVDVVEGAARHIEHLRQRYGDVPGLRGFHCLFQEFEPDCTYDTVVAGDMLRYVPEPRAFLEQVRAWLRPGGTLIATVPNSRSLHRRIGTLLGMERKPTDANARDREVGNLRSYDRYEFRDLLLSAGYCVRLVQGCFLKPLSSAQMQDWDDRLLRAFLEVGDEMQDYCWFIYAVAVSPLAA
jgi:trans-aconitate methyltransferase